jgi:hypothetical protein
MKIVQGDELDWVRGLEHRGGTFHYRNLLEGTPGTIDNFQLSMGRCDKDFVSPRHRHNFDQFRFQLDNTLDFARDGRMTPGTVGFFPEGGSYGPQTCEEIATTIVLQFGGCSGSGYLSRPEVKQGMDELKQFGTFAGGVYRRNPGLPGKRNVDGYQAIWEHVNQRRLEYPKPRYPGPVMMDAIHFHWVPSSEHTGVREKLLGVFTERRAETGFFKLAAGATLPRAGRGIFVCYRGQGRVDGQPLRPLTTVFLDHGEQAVFTADEEIEIIHLGLPDLRGLVAQPQEFTPAVAAE